MPVLLQRAIRLMLDQHDDANPRSRSCCEKSSPATATVLLPAAGEKAILAILNFRRIGAWSSRSE